MDYTTYKLIHYVGIFALLLSLGSMFTQYKKCSAIGHGVGLLLILVAGFGMQAKMGEFYELAYGTRFPLWLIVKMVIWLFFGACIVFAKRGIIKCGVAYILMIACATGAAYLALKKPAFGQKPNVEKADS